MLSRVEHAKSFITSRLGLTSFLGVHFCISKYVALVNVHMDYISLDIRFWYFDFQNESRFWGVFWKREH